MSRPSLAFPIRRSGQRGKILWKIGDLIERHLEELAQLESLDNGKPIAVARAADAPLAADMSRYMAGWTTKIEGHSLSLSVPYTPDAQYHAFTRREPIGVVAQIADTYRTEKTYAIVDELGVIAKAHESTVARVALAWVQAQPGVTSTIIGARRLAQLKDNVQALEIKLSAEELGRLDALTTPSFGFPQNMQPWFPTLHNGGTSVNGISAPTSPFGVQEGDKVY